MVGTTLMRMRSGNYRAAPYLNSFAITPVTLAGVVRTELLLIGELV